MFFKSLVLAWEALLGVGELYVLEPSDMALLLLKPSAASPVRALDTPVFKPQFLFLFFFES